MVTADALWADLEPDTPDAPGAPEGGTTTP
jgi:hypothetical protein